VIRTRFIFGSTACSAATPIGSFLFWNVAPVVVKFTFHQFLRNYHENREPICTQYDPHLGKACLRFLTGNRDSRR
jgi:hypothetical protein